MNRQRPDGSWFYLKPILHSCEYGIPNARAFIVDTNVLPEQTWCYRVAASNNTTSAHSNTVCLTVDIYDPPIAPTLTGTASLSGITLAITDKAVNEAGFRLYRRRSGTNDWGAQIREFAAQSGTGRRISWLDVSVARDRRYDYSVIVHHQYGSTRSNIITVDSWPTLPVPPSNLRLEVVSPTRIMVRWTDNSDNEDDFVVRYTAPGYQDSTRTVGRNGTSLEVSVGSDTTWSFSVTARNESGESAAVSGTVTTPPPQATRADLVPREVDLDPQFPGPSQPFTFRWRECNNGQTAATSYRTVVRRAGSQIGSAMYSLPAGSCQWRELPLPNGLPIGSHTIEVVMDADNTVSESAEGNNYNSYGVIIQ